jgi:hypothetical protein
MPFIWEELRRSLQGNKLFCMWMIGRRCDEEKPVLRYSRMENVKIWIVFSVKFDPIGKSWQDDALQSDQAEQSQAPSYSHNVGYGISKNNS